MNQPEKDAISDRPDINSGPEASDAKSQLSARWYVWVFVLFFSGNLRLLPQTPIEEPQQLTLTFYVVFNLIFVPLFVIWMCLTLIRSTTLWTERAFLVLIAADTALHVAGTLHQLGYLPYSISAHISHWIFFIATVLLGYRMDQVLRNQEKKIENHPCSTLL